MPLVNPDPPEDYAPLYPYALNEATGEIVVASAEHYIDASRTYDKTKDKGCLVCPECRQAKLIHRNVKPMAGGRNVVRDHFARHIDSQHTTQCNIGQRAARMLGKHSVDDRLGAFFYINCDTPSATHPHGGRPPRRAWIAQRAERNIPPHIKKIEYAPHSFLPKKREIITSEFARRPRLPRPAKDILSLIKNLAIINRDLEKAKDSWAIVSRVGFKLSTLFVHYKPDSGIRDLSPANTAKIRDEKKLPANFRFPEDAGYDRFARIFNQVASGITHPVMLHFKVAAHPKTVTKSNETFKVIKFGQYNLERLNPKGVELPTQSIDLCVVTKDPKIAARLKIGEEFMALVHPRVVSYGKKGQNTIQDFDILRPEDVVSMTMTEFKDILENKGRRKRNKKEKPPTAEPT